MITAREMASSYIKKGWEVVRIPPREKRPTEEGWPTRKFTPDDFADGDNIGVKTGDPSGGLVDVDLDHPLAVELAHEFLPPTGATFGHGDGRDVSPAHWLYTCKSPGRTHTWKAANGAMLLELRATGVQTVFPGSIHPCGDSVEWVGRGDPAPVKREDLERACENLIAAVRQRLGGTAIPAPSAAPAPVFPIISSDRNSLLRRAEAYASAAKSAVGPSNGIHGGRTVQAFSLAGHLAAFCDGAMRLTETEILELLRTRWNPRNTPPLSDGKLAATVHSAMVNGTPRADHPGRENVAPPTGKVAPATNPKISSDGPVLIRLADVAAKPVSWVWANRIPARKLSLLGGDPDNGKSLLTLDISARISRGMDWPDNSGRAEVGSVILLSAEDDAADTIRPRLEAAGADLAKIHILEAVRERDKPRPFSLDRDVEQLEPAIKTLPDCRLVVVDPVSAYMGAGTDSHKNTDVRRVLAPLAALAQSSGVAVLAVSHMSKGQGGKALYRSMGSLGFIAAARAAWLVARDKHDPALRLFVPIKNNLAPGGVAGLSYRIESSDLEIPAPRIVWGGPVAVTADEILAAELAPSRGHVREEVEEWLENYLSDGPRPAGEVYQAAEGAGFHKRTVERGKQALGVRAIRQGFGDGGTWVWALNHQTASQEVET